MILKIRSITEVYYSYTHVNANMAACFVSENVAGLERIFDRGMGDSGIADDVTRVTDHSKAYLAVGQKSG